MSYPPSTVVPLKLIKKKHPQILSVLPWSAKSDTVNAKKMQKDKLPYSPLLSTAIRLINCHLHSWKPHICIHVLIHSVCTPKYKWNITWHMYFLYDILAVSFLILFFFSFSCVFLPIFKLNAWRFTSRICSHWTKIALYWFCSLVL